MMLAEMDIPSPLLPLLKLLSRRKTHVRVGEGGKADFHWLVTANSDGREREAREALRILAQRGVITLTGALDEAFRVRATEAGRVALERYFGVADEPIRRWQSLPDALFHDDWDVQLKMTPLPEVSGISWSRQLQCHNKLYAQLPALNLSSTTLRQLSARYFWGDSKYLEQLPAQVLRMIYHDYLDSVGPRQLLAHAALGDKAQLPVLLVENQDSFQALAQLRLPYHVIYLAGFKGTTERMRKAGSVCFFYDYRSPKSNVEGFENRWFSDTQLPVYFWGDLDFSGITMMNALLQWLPNLQAWRPGYQPMVDALERDGHPACLKSGQPPPTPTGIAYVDEVLIPAMQSSGRFLDQEWVDIAMLAPSACRPT